MRRREFITLVSGAAAGWPLATRAQQSGKIRRIGVVVGAAESDPQIVTDLAAFKAALAALGWIDGSNVHVEYRFAEADADRIQRETSTIPIVFVVVSDPVGSGFVVSLPRPGGNITGFINIETSLSGKWVEILKEIVPRVARAALLFNPDTAPYFAFYQQPFEAAARSNGVEPIAAPIRTGADIERVFQSLGERPDTGLVLLPDVYLTTTTNLALVTSLVTRYRVPTIFPYRYMVAAGGLISYGIDIVDLWRRAPTYVDRILKGAKPADLPVQLPTKFELAINLKTAKAIGLDMPATMLGRADEVIE
jgi:putative tryptophan/tyrosine transport system substrate-binding protein